MSILTYCVDQDETFVQYFDKDNVLKYNFNVIKNIFPVTTKSIKRTNQTLVSDLKGLFHRLTKRDEGIQLLFMFL